MKNILLILLGSTIIILLWEFQNVPLANILLFAFAGWGIGDIITKLTD